MNVTDDVLYDAIKFAVKAHKKHKRKVSGAPYIIHPMATLSYLYETKSSKNMNLLATCMILHDVVEDTDITLNKIRKKFGYYVAAIIEELTNDPTMIDQMGKTNYLKAKMIVMSSYALLLKLCDRLHNIIDRDKWDDYVASTEEIVNALVEGRHLSETHKVLIKKINSVIYKLKNKV